MDPRGGSQRGIADVFERPAIREAQRSFAENAIAMSAFLDPFSNYAIRNRAMPPDEIASGHDFPPQIAKVNRRSDIPGSLPWLRDEMSNTSLSSDPRDNHDSNKRVIKEPPAGAAHRYLG